VQRASSPWAREKMDPLADLSGGNAEVVGHLVLGHGRRFSQRRGGQSLVEFLASRSHWRVLKISVRSSAVQSKRQIAVLHGRVVATDKNASLVQAYDPLIMVL